MKPMFVSNCLRRIARLPAAWLFALVLAVSPAGAAEVLRLGQKPGIEQALVAEMTMRLLNQAGVPVERIEPMATAPIRAAQRRGDIDLYWGFTGTALATFNRKRPPFDSSEVLEQVRRLDADKGLVWLEASGVRSIYGFVAHADRAKGFDIETISDLAARINDGWRITLATDPEFFARPDGLKPLQAWYDFTWPQDAIVRRPVEELDALLDSGEVDFIAKWMIDAEPAARGNVVLEDDRGYFPPYVMAPVIRAEALAAFPEVEAVLARLARELDSEALHDLVVQVTEKGESLEAAAGDFLAGLNG